MQKKRNSMNSRKEKIMMIFLIGGVIVCIFLFRKSIYKPIDLIAYEEELLGIELQNYVQDASGKVQRREEYATVKLKIKAGYEEKVEHVLTSRCGESLNIESFKIPGYAGHEFVNEIKSNTLQQIYVVMLEGKRAKTRSIEIYVTVDENREMYMYIFG